MSDELPPEEVDPELLAMGWVPPDPDEPRPVELWSTVGDVRPWGTLVLMFAWGVVFLGLGATRALDNGAALTAWGASTTGLGAWASAWRLLASTFLHAGAAHLFFNATSMLVMGPSVERLFTRWGFWLVYALGGAAASAASLTWRAQHVAVAGSLSVGASGAIFALSGALLVAAIRLRRHLAPSRARALGAALLYMVAPGLAAGWARVGTDNVAHVAGVLAGGVLGALLPLNPRFAGRPIPALERVLAVACALALAASLAIAVTSGWRGR